MGRTSASYRSGEVARLAGVSADTLRHYERLGILPKAPRSPSGYRLYGTDAVERVRMVQAALPLGFTLDELSEILRVRDNGGAPCRRVLNLTEAKLRSLEQQIKELRTTQRYMRDLVREWRAKLEETSPGRQAKLLHSLADRQLPIKRNEPFPRRKL
jgi:DNA-binding transcriptional MerR regulator